MMSTVVLKNIQLTAWSELTVHVTPYYIRLSIEDLLVYVHKLSLHSGTKQEFCGKEYAARPILYLYILYFNIRPKWQYNNNNNNNNNGIYL